MKSTAFIAATLALSAVAVSAQSSDEGRLYYSSPITATVWTAGKNETVSWTNACKPGNKDSLDIVLYMNAGHGSDTEQVRVPGLRSLGTLNCLKSKTATVFIPKHVVTGNTYSIHVDTVPLQSYSAQFTINGVNSPTPPPSTTGAPGEGVVGTATGTASVVAPTAATTTTAGVVAPTVTDSTAAKNENSASKMTFSVGVAVVAATIGSFFV
ncbi:hypothetical protein BG015_011468 [Linnemannia schmuckeri]|uniref:Ser-Thr-rich glycosyl-phosphatidyl-inositol-anchored membrane family-domain-containing protein n=1 Tax=Linnemannia schmuckeri TaxID=64567 RepID=A0A9P5S889_9FUNG|nr:hypothetical protein BG015_011468 [Linnemannia schmuckeri]